MYRFQLGKYMNPQEHISITRLKNHRHCVPHVHEFVEMIFIVDGKATHYIDEKRYDVEPGDLLFVNFGQSHAFENGDEDYEYYNILYLPEFFGNELINSESIYDIFETSLFREFEESGQVDIQKVSFRGKEFAEIKRMIESMQKEMEHKETGYGSILSGYSRVLMSKMLREIRGKKSRIEAKKCINKITLDLLAYIDERCFEKISLKEIAEQTFYNPSYLSRLFKTRYGIGLSDYIKEKRMEEAARLLSESDSTVDEIVHKVGYSDRKQFYKNFKDIYQMTPAEYRKTLRG